MTEFEMITDCYNKLLSQNIYRKVLLEVPFLSRSIDMVLVDLDGNIITIEFKLHDWNRAIQQAKDHQLGSDKAYICMPKRHLTLGLLNELERNRIGLLFYDPNEPNPLNEIVSADEINTSWAMWKLSLKRSINSVADEEVCHIIPSSNAVLSPL